LCACELQRLGEELESARNENQKLRGQLLSLERELRRKYGTLSRLQEKEFADAREKILGTEKANTKKFELATLRLFQTLYHEAFHAYLANFVYPPTEFEVPRWLNEGLAQIFETPTLDGSELFVGHPDGNRLARVQADLRKGEWLPLVDLLKAGADSFAGNRAG